MVVFVAVLLFFLLFYNSMMKIVALTSTCDIFALIIHITDIPYQKNIYSTTHSLSKFDFSLIFEYFEYFLINSSFFLIFFADEAHKKLDEYAQKDNKSTAAKKSSETSNNNHNKGSVNKNSKRSNLKKRSDKANYSHNWLLTTLKGHSGSVMDMSFSSNGKYLATCGDGEFI